jgi:hypothetical protein
VDGFLTDEQVRDYTGRTQTAAQARVLQKWKIKHIVNGANRVRVTWEAINAGIKPGGQEPEKTTVDLSMFEEET